MPTVIAQRWEGAKVIGAEDSEIESEYLVTGTNDEFVAQADLDAWTALNVFGLIKKSVTIEERISEYAWGGTVKWGRFEPLELGDSQYSFDTGGGTAHVATSIATLSRTAAPGVPAAPNFQNAIGVTDNGVDGTDITAPAYAFEETHIIDGTVVTAAYKSTLFFLTGAWNNAAYKGFAVGECMFKGASGTLKDYAVWEITYKFVCIPNKSSFAAGPITVPLKRGHDYLWVRYREVEDAVAGHLARRPIAAYVEQVSPSGNLALIGI
jgi:hypothetical protein